MNVPAPLVPIAEPEWELRRTRAAERLANILALIFATAIVVAVFWALADVMLLIFAAALFACLLRGAADGLADKVGGKPGWWLTASILTVLTVIGLTLWLRGPVLATEFKEVFGQIREQLKSVWDRLGSADWMQPIVARAKSFVDEGSHRFAGIAAGVGTTTLGGIGSLVVLFVAAVYFAIDPDIYVKGCLSLMPKPWRPRAAAIMQDIGETLRWWFIGQAIDMLAIGVLTGIGLYLLGVKLAFTLALIAALFNFVPYIGALAGAVPAVLVAFGQGPQTALYVGILFVGVQMLEGNVIAPLIQKQTVELAPVLTILSQTVLGSLFGPLGLILATPLTAAGVVAVRKVYVEGVLDDHGYEPIPEALG